MKPLEHYLNDHLAGAAGALGIVKLLRDEDAKSAEFYQEIGRRIAENRERLVAAIAVAGCRRSRRREALGRLTSAAARMRLRLSGMRAGEPGRLEALEILVLGIEGQFLLWSLLCENSAGDPAWADFDFQELMESARNLHKEVGARHRHAFHEAWHVSRRG